MQKDIVANVLAASVVPLFKNLDDNHNIVNSVMRTDFSSFIKNGIITIHFNNGVNEDNIHASKWVYNYPKLIV